MKPNPLDTTQTEPSFQPLFELLSKIKEDYTSISSNKPQFALVEAFWNIGRLIVENEQGGDKKALYGENLLDRLSGELTLTFGKGYNATNLRWARQLYSSYPIHHTLCDELDLASVLNGDLSWSHYRTLLKLKDIDERDFYIQEIAEHNWSVRFTKRMIEADFYYTRRPDYELPSPTPQRGSSVRLTKSRIKAIGLATKGWSFIHPKSFLIDNKDLLFYQISEKEFIYLTYGIMQEDWGENFRRRLQDAFGQPASMSVFNYGEDLKIWIQSTGNEIVSTTIMQKFNGSLQ